MLASLSLTSLTPLQTPLPLETPGVRTSSGGRRLAVKRGRRENIGNIFSRPPRCSNQRNTRRQVKAFTAGNSFPSQGFNKNLIKILVGSERRGGNGAFPADGPGRQGCLASSQGNLWRTRFHGPDPFLLHVSFNRSIFFRQINVSSADLAFPFPLSPFERLSRCRGLSVWLATVPTPLLIQAEMRGSSFSSGRAWIPPARLFVLGLGLPSPQSYPPPLSLQIQVF